MTEKKNVFIVGLDDFNLAKLQRLPRAKQCNFYAALHTSEIRQVDAYDLRKLIDLAAERMSSFEGSVDAVATYYDFPGSTLVPILAKRFGLPGPSLEAIIACEHKYWSRLEQRKAIPDNIPAFHVFDPFDEHAAEKIDLLPPYWVKPVKSFRSFLAFKINGPGQFADAMETVREHIDLMSEPFRWLMKEFGLPAEFADMKETMIAEAPLSGSMCTLEGYAFEGKMVGYGIVDSVREPDRSSFARYEYPSSLPMEIQHRMIDLARQAIAQIELDNTAFNIEFFYDQTNDHVFLLEINPRLSQDHSDVFEKVLGHSHLRVMLDLALGIKPAPFERRGKHNIAANVMLRVYEAGRVTRAPTSEAIEAVKSAGLASEVKVHVEEGQELGSLKSQDSYSYELANLFIAGRDQLDILEKYDKALELLSFEIQRGPERIAAPRPRLKFVWDGEHLPPELEQLEPGEYLIETAP